VFEALPTYLEAFHTIEGEHLTLHLEIWHVSLGASIIQRGFMICRDCIH
jgi:hypothetical protein